MKHYLSEIWFMMMVLLIKNKEKTYEVLKTS